MKKLFLLLVALLAIGLCASAQTRTVKGTVVDAATAEPLIGASVTAAGSTMGVTTDLDGDFTIVVPTSVSQLTISYVGYQTQKVTIGEGKLMVQMHAEQNVLDEVIAVAYGTSKRSEYTGSAAVVKADQLEDVMVSTATNALSGRASGVQIISSNGQPGEQPSVLIRGVGSINASTAPLYVVDGVPYSGDLSGIATNDIESMTVLKDAASTALYGARGANGVILITTKRGKEGSARVTFDARWGVNERAIPNYDVVTDSRQYIEQVYQSLYMTSLMTGANAGNTDAARQYALNNLWSSIGYQTWTAPTGQSIIGADGKFNPNATPGYYNEAAGFYYLADDWSKLQLRNGLRQEYTLSVSGGDDKFTYYLSGAYLGDEGIITGSHFQRLSTRASVDYQAKPWLKIGTNLSYTYVNSGYPDEQTSSGSNGNAFRTANECAPVYPMYVRDANGNIVYNKEYNRPIYDYGDGMAGAVRAYAPMSNPTGDLAYNLEENLMDILDAKAYAILTPLKGLTINGNIGYFLDNTRNHMIANPLYGQSASYNGQALQYQSRLRTINAQFIGEYQRSFNEVHNASIMVGYESFSQNNEYVEAIGNNLYNPGQWAVNNTIDQRRGYGAAGEYSTRGWIGRLKYNYAEKYFFQASFRRDASSRFHPDKRWGSFWSASAAWEVAKENFMQDFENVDMLKVKFSFGQNGNDNVGNAYAYLDQYNLTGENGVFNDAQLVYKGNPDLTWETSTNINAGVDFSFFKGRISGTAEYYQRTVSDMLFNIPVAPSLGYSSIPMNIGKIRNNGFEIDANFNVLNLRDVQLDVFANLTIPTSKVLELSPDILDGDGNWFPSSSRIFYEGGALYNMYLVEYAGVDPETGKALYWAREPLLDADGNQVVENGISRWSDEEYKTDVWTDAYYSNRKETGNIMPKGYGGFGVNVQAYGFDASVTFAYQFGGKIYDNSYSAFMHGFNTSSIGTNIHKDLLNAWTPTNTNTDVPRLSNSDQYTRSLSTRFLTSSNYLSLNNITVGYTLPESITKKAYLHGVRIYFAAENVALWSKRKGLDPRQGYTASSNATYSPIRNFSGGIRFSF